MQVPPHIVLKGDRTKGSKFYRFALSRLEHLKRINKRTGRKQLKDTVTYADGTIIESEYRFGQYYSNVITIPEEYKKPKEVIFPYHFSSVLYVKSLGIDKLTFVSYFSPELLDLLILQGKKYVINGAFIFYETELNFPQDPDVVDIVDLEATIEYGKTEAYLRDTFGAKSLPPGAKAKKVRLLLHDHKYIISPDFKVYKDKTSGTNVIDVGWRRNRNASKSADNFVVNGNVITIAIPIPVPEPYDWEENTVVAKLEIYVFTFYTIYVGNDEYRVVYTKYNTGMTYTIAKLKSYLLDGEWLDGTEVVYTEKGYPRYSLLGNIPTGSSIEKVTDEFIYVQFAVPKTIIHLVYEFVRDQYGIITGLKNKTPINQKADKSYGILYMANGEKFLPFGKIDILSPYVNKVTQSGFVDIWEQSTEYTTPYDFDSYKIHSTGNKTFWLQEEGASSLLWYTYGNCVDTGNDPLKDDDPAPLEFFYYDYPDDQAVGDNALVFLNEDKYICYWFNNKVVVAIANPIQQHYRFKYHTRAAYVITSPSPRIITTPKNCCARYSTSSPHICLEHTMEAYGHIWSCGKHLTLFTNDLGDFLPTITPNKFLPVASHPYTEYYNKVHGTILPTPMLGNDCGEGGNLPDIPDDYYIRFRDDAEAYGENRLTIPDVGGVIRTTSTTDKYKTEKPIWPYSTRKFIVDIFAPGIYYKQRFRLTAAEGINDGWIEFRWLYFWNRIQVLIDRDTRTNFGEVLFVKSVKATKGSRQIDDVKAEPVQHMLYINGKEYYNDIYTGIYKLHKKDFDAYVHSNSGVLLDQIVVSSCNYM